MGRKYVENIKPLSNIEMLRERTVFVQRI